MLRQHNCRMSQNSRALTKNLQNRLEQGQNYFICESHCFDIVSYVENDKTPKAIITETCIKFLYDFLVSLAYDLPQHSSNESLEQTKILHEFRHFYTLPSVLNALTYSSFEVETFFHDIDDMPESPQWFSRFQISLQKIIKRLAAAYRKNETEQWKSLYFEHIEYMMVHAAHYDDFINPEIISNILYGHIKGLFTRLNGATKRRISWGKELYQYFIDEKSKGISDKISMIRSRRRFRQNHSEIEKSGDPLPGLTSQSLRSYFNAYLETLSS